MHAGAHNTIVTARAGKDLVSCLVSGLLTIGPRFGGAVDDAARHFQDACDRGAQQLPSLLLCCIFNNCSIMLRLDTDECLIQRYSLVAVCLIVLRFNSYFVMLVWCSDKCLVTTSGAKCHRLLSCYSI